ncbi:MAG: L-type lectin-domain containing protein [Bryobacteraceae bacterium]
MNKVSFLRAAICAGTALFGLAAAAGATQFTYSGFSNTAGLTLVGDAATASTTDGTVLRVTPASGNQSGAAYSTSPFTLGTSDTFSTQFQFRFTNQGGIDPADGITFVLAASPTGLGGLGGAIGYQGVANSVAIEFDTYNNGSSDDNSDNHVGIDTSGTLTDTALTNVYGNSACGFGGGAGCMSNGDLWTVNMSYNGSMLNVTLDDPTESSSFTALNNYGIDVASYLGTNSAYVGFTSGTGSGFENHDIVDWTFANTAQLPPPSSSVPEPRSLLLLGVGLFGLACMARRKQQRGI